MVLVSQKTFCTCESDVTFYMLHVRGRIIYLITCFFIRNTFFASASVLLRITVSKFAVEPTVAYKSKNVLVILYYVTLRKKIISI